MGLKEMFSKKRSVELPPEGRSSDKPQTLNGVMGALGGYYDAGELFDSLAILENLAVYNPDVSHSIRNWINMANSGHQVIIESGSDATKQKVLDELNRLASELYHGSYGIDGLMNHYFNQIAVTGAISSEDILEKDFSGVRKIELIRTSQIRFKYEDEGWQPYQYINGRYFRLHPVTYRYFSHLRLREDRPYAKPLIIAAIEPVNRQLRMHENIDYIMKKFGLLGFVDLTVSPPQRQRQESEVEFQERNRKYLADVARAVSSSYRDGVLVHFDDQKFTYNNIGAMSQGSYEVHKMNEEQVFSGIGIDPAMQGRSFSTTETYAGVVYNLLANECRVLQRMAKRRLEATYKLHLLLKGYDVDVSIQWNDVPEKDPKARAEREKIEIENVMAKVKSGLITPDQGAQELGYDEWIDPGKVAATFDVTQNEYVQNRHPRFFRFSTDRTPAAVRRSFTKQESDKTPEDRRFERLMVEYFESIRPTLTEAERIAVDSVIEWIRIQEKTPAVESLAQKASECLREALSPLNGNSDFSAKIQASVSTIYEASRFTETRIEYKDLDRRIVDFSGLTDRFLITSYVDNDDFQKPMLTYLQDAYKRYGDNLWGRMSQSAIDAFRNEFSGHLEDLADHQIYRIMNTTVQTLRNFGEIAELDELDIEKTEVFEAMGELACPICREFHGKVFSVKAASDSVRDICNQSPTEYLQTLRAKAETFKGLRNYRGKPIESLVKQNMALPPYHPNCKGRVLKHREVIAKQDGSTVNKAEAGKQVTMKHPVQPTDAKTPKEKRMAVDYTVIDRWGQKVYVTDQTTKAAQHTGMARHIPSILKNAERLITSRTSADKMAYIDAKGRVAIVYSDGNVYAWTAFQPRDLAGFVERFKDGGEE